MIENMATNDDWIDCGKHISEYKVQVLPRGDEESYLDFQTTYQLKNQRGYKKSEEQIKQEAEQAFQRKEQKIMSMDVD